MAVAIEFINFIVPVSLIHKRYPGGWDQCLADHEHMIGGKVWFDDYLFRDGAMNPMDMKSIVKWWENQGFEVISEIDGMRRFKDGCVVEGMFGGTTLPCDWISIAEGGSAVYLKDTVPGAIVGRKK